MRARALNAEERMRRRGPAEGSGWSLAVGLVCAALNLGYAFFRLPPLSECLRLSATPLDRSGIHDSAADYELLVAAADVVPSGARVAMWTASGDRERDAILYRFAVALLPGRRVVPGTAPQVLSARDAEDADYVILRGSGQIEKAKLLRVEAAGSVWRRR